jgi:hypothetical protein
MVKPKPTQKIVNQVPQTSANNIARYMHDALLGKSDLLTRQQIMKSRVQYDMTRENTTERIHVNGEIDGRKAYQTLSYSPKSCRWYFTTVFTAPGGEAIHRHIAAGNDGSADMIKVLNESLFMQRLNQVLNDS